ncbi:ABC transporter ATP-binding protein [Xanthocytophaga flava]|uniref:ABC transporter ATP-binding protein n=1 Tax=Xanthocytophaga flava TaxID=3048013 RepID=UPI0028D2951A|nr:ABC transporter ATP-binding protein [Xanthocytophaga flavus]MDJ1468129.1 ABC transporter ATP-binding protein [Xanthocytophaga flavus]
MTARKSILTAVDLSIGYRLSKEQTYKIAGPLQLNLWQGELVCLLGPNGAGKSTLMRTLAGLHPALEGYISITNLPLSDLKPQDLARKLSMVLTERVGTGNLTVYELVALGRYPYTSWLGTLTAKDVTKVYEAMDVIGITAYQHRSIQYLSDGERQKVMLARALAQDTDMIMLDEPTAHLDLPSRVEMMQLLHQLAKKTQKAILLSTHELDLALQAADKVWILLPDGSLEVGTPEDLVLKGAFESAFARKGLHFDQATGSFVLHNDSQGPVIGLSGHKDLVFWTRRALQREGFCIETDQTSAYRIEALFTNNQPDWTLYQNGISVKYNSMAEVLAALQLWKKQISTIT